MATKITFNNYLRNEICTVYVTAEEVPSYLMMNGHGIEILSVEEVGA